MEITTCLAGNVFGGGYFAADRIIPDCIRAAQEGKNIIVRNPFSTRPYQHVLEPVIAYLMIAEAQYKNKEYAGNYNIGPDETDCWTTGRLVDLFCKEWKRQTGDDVVWVNQHDGGPHEANYLKLDCSKIKGTFEWKPRWNVEIAMSKIVEWTNCYQQHGDVNECMTNQIRDFLEQ